MKILVTGGSGLVGEAVVTALWRAGHGIRVLSRHPEEEAELFADHIEPHPADIANPSELPGAVVGCDAVIHIAGIVEESPGHSFEKVNVEGTANLLATAEREGRPLFIYISSLGADEGTSEYHRSKLRAEQRVRQYGGPWLILRPGNVFGPKDEVISLLLRMVRALPAVPIVGDGNQRFQPLWHSDFGEIVRQALQRPDLVGQTLELAGAEVTTTNDLLDRLERIVDRHPARIPVSEGVAEFTASALEARDGAGRRALESLGFPLPLDPAKLTMLREESIIAADSRNAALSVFELQLTPLEVGLLALADQLPEQFPGEGVGTVKQEIFTVEIVGSDFTPAQLLQQVAQNLNDVMPLDFAAEPGSPSEAARGDTITGAIPGRGHLQVRLALQTESRLTFLTVEGHPLAGMLSFTADRNALALRFSIQLISQASNAADWLALRTVGDFLQRQNWRNVLKNVVSLSGGRISGVIHEAERALSPGEIRAAEEQARDLARNLKRDAIAN